MDRDNTIRTYHEEGKTLREVAQLLGVTKQRVYQLYKRLGLQTRARYLKTVTDDDPKKLWLRSVLRSKGLHGDKQLELLMTTDLPDRCPVLGIPLDYSFGKGSRTENSPSVDQLDAGHGYSVGNVYIISWRANRVKNDGTEEEHRKIAEWMNNVRTLNP